MHKSILLLSLLGIWTLQADPLLDGRKPAMAQPTVKLTSDDELDITLSTIKLKPKSKSSALKTSSKCKTTCRTVAFGPPEPDRNQVAEPKDVPLTVKINHNFKMVLTATV
jgi:hypothetical protein